MLVDIKIIIVIAIMLIAHFSQIQDFKASGMGAGIGWFISILIGIILSFVSWNLLSWFGI